MTKAKKLKSNTNIAFQGPVKVGEFDIPQSLAQEMLHHTNPSGKNNADVLKQYLNADDITQRSRGFWIIDFDNMTETEARDYIAPFKHVETHIKPKRLQNNDRQRRENWWKLGRSGSNYHEAIKGLRRQIFTPRVAKYRVFVWQPIEIHPSDAVVAIARDDDYFFGVLHSYLHEIWSLRKGTWLGQGNDPRYTPTTTLETFPFPYPINQKSGGASQNTISSTAVALHTEREAWLNPQDLLALDATEKALKDRTLTNLYNAVSAYREGKNGRNSKIPEIARKFAPRMMELHDHLDKAVLSAYGWDDLVGILRTSSGEETLLKRLLEENQKQG